MNNLTASLRNVRVENLRGSMQTENIFSFVNFMSIFKGIWIPSSDTLCLPLSLLVGPIFEILMGTQPFFVERDKISTPAVLLAKISRGSKLTFQIVLKINQ